ncbi:MAG: hypothetical protein SGILL_005570, partial [Bacillariaceae sp.]
LPWKLSGDLKHFAKVTTTVSGSSSSSPKSTATTAIAKQNAVIMGRNTWNSIPEKFRPLKGRTNVVLTSNSSLNVPDNVLIASSLSNAWQQLAQRDDLGEIFVIGGQQVYQQAIQENYISKIILTEVDTPSHMEFDTYFPDVFESKDWKQYLDLIQNILDNGVVRGDRTGTGTKSIFGAQMRFNLRDGQLPLLTTKKTFWRGVAEELLWFISGSTNANELAAKNIHIWDGNGSKEFLESRGLGHREEGDLGPVYGFQWRHFGADYVDMHTDYTGQGVDQLQQCIDKIRNSPEDRRILMSAWNPSALDDMALPPCHLLCQFFVDTTRNELSCQLYQRSADMGLGVPFNIASYALLTHLMAHVTGRKPGELVHTLGDAHVYLNHIEPLKEQLQREPRPFPKLVIDNDPNHDKTIDDFKYEDLDVIGYHPYKAISMKMAV